LFGLHEVTLIRYCSALKILNNSGLIPFHIVLASFRIDSGLQKFPEFVCLEHACDL